MHLLDDLDEYGTTGLSDITGLLLEPVAWHKDAGCLDADPEVFLPQPSGLRSRPPLPA